MVRSFTVRPTMPEEEPPSSGSSDDGSDTDDEGPHEVDRHELVEGLTKLPLHIANIIGYEHLGQLRHALASHVEVLTDDEFPVYTLVAECRLRKRLYQRSRQTTSLSAAISAVARDVMAATSTSEEVAMPVIVAVMIDAPRIPPFDELEGYLQAFAETGGAPVMEGDDEWPTADPALGRRAYAALIADADPEVLFELADAVGLLAQSPRGGAPTRRARIRIADLQAGHRRCIPVVRATLADVRDGRHVDESFTVQRAKRAAPPSPRTCRRAMRDSGLRYLSRRRQRAVAAGGANKASDRSETSAGVTAGAGAAVTAGAGAAVTAGAEAAD